MRKNAGRAVLVEILDIVGPLIEIGYPAILLYQLFQVWERLNAVTDRLITLTQEFEAYREKTEDYRAEIQRQMRASNDAN